MSEPRSTSPSDVQYVVPASLRPDLDSWLRQRGLVPVEVSSQPDDFPTYLLDPSTPERGSVVPAASRPAVHCRSQTVHAPHDHTVGGVDLRCPGRHPERI